MQNHEIPDVEQRTWWQRKMTNEKASEPIWFGGIPFFLRVRFRFPCHP